MGKLSRKPKWVSVPESHLEVVFSLVIHDSYQVVCYLVVIDDLQKGLKNVAAIPPKGNV